jgi:hypothetical protein
MNKIKTTHTQGEWKVVAQMPSGYTIENEKGQVIAVIDENSDISKEEAMANAKLIATAPELLKALRRLLSEACHNSFIATGDLENTILEQDAVDAIFKAI